MSLELQNTQRRNIPGVSLVYAGVGKKEGNEELLNKFAQKFDWDQRQIDAAVKQVAGSGINRRFRLGRPYEGPTEDYRREVIEASTLLTRESLRTAGWDSADLLVAVNSIPPDKKSEWAREVAEKSNIPEVMEVNATCNGGVLGLAEVLKNPDLRNSRVVITAYEALSRFVNPDDLMSGAIFGSGGASMAFEPNRFEVINAVTVVKEDKDGVIKVPKSYEVTDELIQGHFPEWFKVDLGSEGVVSRTDRLVRIALPAPLGDPNRIEMDGKATAIYFAGWVSQILAEGLSFYKQEYLITPGIKPIEFIAAHQPSKIVFDHVARRLGKLIDKDEGLSGVKKPDMPWVLERVGMSNISPGTTFIAIAELLERIQRETFMLAAYGVGASASRLILRYQ